MNVRLGPPKSDTSDKRSIYPVDRDLLNRFCTHFRDNKENNPSTSNFYLYPPELDEVIFDINENALKVLFPLFNAWLHGLGYLRTPNGNPARILGLLTLCRLYVFGDLLGAPLFSDAVIDEIKQKRQVFDACEFSAIRDAIMYVYGLPYMALRAAVLDFIVVNSGPWVIVAFDWPSIARKDMLDTLFAGCKSSIECRASDDAPRYLAEVDEW